MGTGHARVAIVGAGVVGCACARALLRRGFAVTVLERGGAIDEAPGETGAASWAAAGILGAQIATREDGPLARMCVESRALYPAFVAELEGETELDVELRPCGIVRPALTADELAGFEAAARWQPGAGLHVDRLDAAALRRAVPDVSYRAVGAVAFPDEARIDPPKLLAALRRAIVAGGADLRFGVEARGVIDAHGRVTGVALAGGFVEADAVLVAAGSWTSRLETGRASFEVEPARGQMIELRVARPRRTPVLEGAHVYLSPRDDGRVLVGSTVELVGHDRRVTAGALQSLLGAAIELVPSLADASFSRAWAGFRPRTADELPRIGPGDAPGLFFATGHHRNGVLLAPLTAERIARAIDGT